MDFLNQALENPTTDTLEVSPTCLTVDSWGRRKGRELFHAPEVVNDTTVCDIDADEWADCHAACFEPRPKLVDNPGDETRANWFRDLLATDDYKSLHKQTRGRLDLSRVAAIEVGKQWSEFAGLDDDAQSDPMNAAGSVAGAVRASRKAVSEAVDAMEGLGGGCGGHGGDSGTELAADKIVGMFNRVKNDRFLHDVMRSAGKFRRVARSLQRRKTKHGVDDMVGVTVGSNVNHLTQSELANFCSDELELLTLHRIATNRAMVKDYRGVEPVGKGPIVVIVDESGSMSGDKIITAKGLALTLGWVAKQQNRWIAFVGFSGGTEGNRLAMAPNAWDQDKLVDWLKHFYGKGTTLDVPVDQVPNTYWPEFLAQGMPRGKVDIVIVTDDAVDCPQAMVDHYNAWRKSENVTAYGIRIGSGGYGSMDKICDQTFCVRSLETDCDAVQEVLSV